MNARQIVAFLDKNKNAYKEYIDKLENFEIDVRIIEIN